ncbi:hypothetical protein [Streptomyces sp. NPDC001108]
MSRNREAETLVSASPARAAPRSRPDSPRPANFPPHWGGQTLIAAVAAELSTLP